MDWNKALERLRADRGNWSRVARATGLHENGIRRIASGDTPWPRIDTTQKIIAYYIALDAGVSVGGDPAPTPQGMPRPVATTPATSPPSGVTHENCFAGIDLTFEPRQVHQLTIEARGGRRRGAERGRRRAERGMR